MGLDQAERRRNVKGAFLLTPEGAAAIGGKSVLLVDDVRTTGATAEACATVLRKAGARQVNLLSFALDPILRSLRYSDGLRQPSPRSRSTRLALLPLLPRRQGAAEEEGASFEEIDVQDPALRQQMMIRSSGRRTVPQTYFIGEQHVGGSDDIHELDRRGQLDFLLQPQ